MMLQAIKFAILAEEYDQAEYENACGVLSCESLLFLWWLVNFTIINTLGPHLSVGMIIMEVVYALVTLWFFAIITMKGFEKSSCSIICNPLVIIIGPVTLILLSVIALIAFISNGIIY